MTAAAPPAPTSCPPVSWFLSFLLLLIHCHMSRAVLLRLHGSTSSLHHHQHHSLRSRVVVVCSDHAPPPRGAADTGFLGRQVTRVRAGGRPTPYTSSSSSVSFTTSSTTFPRRSPMTMMPEGPEVRTLTNQLQPAVGRSLHKMEFLSGRYSAQKPPDGYHPKFFDHNTVITKWNCKGKFMYVMLQQNDDILADDDYQLSVWFTLGMTGKFLNEAAHRELTEMMESEQRSTTRNSRNRNGDNSGNSARWYLELLDCTTNVTSRIYYHDPRSFGTVKFCTSRAELAAKLSSLGPDLLSESMSATDFVGIVESTRPTTNICRFLMDQSKVSGIGNYILAEGLYKANIDPFCSLEELNVTQQINLFGALKETAQQSYAAQGMTRGPNGKYTTLSGDRGQFEFELCCYGRQRCLHRNDIVHRELHGPHGRTIWYTDAQLFMPRSERSNVLQLVSSEGSSSRIVRSPSTSTSNPSRRKRTLSGGSDGSDDVALDPSSSAAAVEWLLKGLVEPSWKNALADHFATPSFQQLAVFVDHEYRTSGPVYPPRQEIFAALNAVPIDGVRVVIVGQDPYHGPGEAHGLAFSVPKRVRPPPRLQNVLKELNDDLGMSDPPTHGCLTSWAQQGVLLLNTVLTVRAGEAFSHANRGWEEFTDAVLETVVRHHSDRGVVFLLWGNPAQAKARCVSSDSAHCIIKTSHPSPLGARKTASPFLGSRCFSRANAALMERHYDPIDWSLS